MLAQLANTGGGIMLMHDIHMNTMLALPELLDAMLEAGVEFVRLDDEGLFPSLNAQIEAPEPPACCEGVVR